MALPGWFRRRQFLAPKFMKIRLKKINIRGITLLESILAVGLIMAVVIGSITMGIYTTRLGRSSDNKIVALNLAREGIEYVRNLRDSNWLNDRAWDEGIEAKTYILSQYLNDSDKWISEFTELTAGVSKNLKINSDGIYNHESGEETNFSRSITITKGSDIGVVSKVEWLENGRPRDFILEENLYDWRDD